MKSPVDIHALIILSIVTGLRLNGAHQLLVYAGDVNVLGGRVHIIKK